MSAAGKKLTEDQIVNVIRTYLSAWQTVAGFDFSSSTSKESGVAIKMAGLKYMIYILRPVWDYSIQCKEKFTKAFVEKTLKKVIDQYGVLYADFFTNKELNSYFRDRTMIMKFAEETSDKIKKLGAEEFNPLG